MMNMERNARADGGSLTGRLCEKKVTREISADFVIPESQPEARRILAVTERLLPPAKYVGSSTLECNGVIDYRVLYLGVDGELWGVCFSSEYELEAPMDQHQADISGGVDTMIMTVCEGSSARVSSGRRLNIRSRLSSDIWAYGEISNEVGGGELEEDTVERRFSSVECASFGGATSEVIDLSDEISGFFPDSRVISADATAYVGDIRRGEDSLVATGEVCLKLLVCREGQRAEPMIKKIPFEGVVELMRPVGNASCRVDCSVTDLAINVGEGKADASVSVVLCADMAENLEISYVADAYSLERESTCHRSELGLPVSALCTRGNFSQSERRPLSEVSIPDGARLVEVFPRVIFDGCQYNGRYEITGRSNYLILWEKDGEYGTAEIEFPVRYEAEGREVDSPVSAVRGEVISCRGRIDGELLCIDSEICANVSVVGNECAELVRDITLGEPYAREKNRMVIYYPADGETPWDVAKRYHVRADSLAEEKNYYMF